MIFNAGDSVMDSLAADKGRTLAQGVRYMTNGAVCGNWWDGSYLSFPPAYVMVNLYEDGSADSTFVAYQQG